MAVTLQQVADACGTDAAQASLPGILAFAQVLVDDYIARSCGRRVPTAIRDDAVVEVCARKWERMKNPNGTIQFGPDGQVSYLSNDPLRSVRPQLDAYRGLGAVG